jgi:hypothetical protein
MIRPRPSTLIAAAALALSGTALPAQPAAKPAKKAPPLVYDRVILGGRVVDPSSKLDEVRNVGISGGRIAILTPADIRGRDTINAKGLVVAPGFIDLHSHAQTAEGYRAQALDGVTTSLELEIGTADVEKWYAERRPSQLINYGVSAGHLKARTVVMHDTGSFTPVGPGARNAASPAELSDIMGLIDAGLRAGAVAVGAGFTYTPGATHEELLELFTVAARWKTTVHVHIRNGMAGLNEVLGLQRETKAPLHIVHLNSGALAETPEELKTLTAARAKREDVTTEAYPYPAGMTDIASATIQDMYRGADDARLSQIEWPATGERLNRASFEKYSKQGGLVAIHSNTEPMVLAAIASPLTMIASDAVLEHGIGHPRAAGTFSRVLGRYVREQKALTLTEAIRKMTLLPAQRLEKRAPVFRSKGRLRSGMDADVTIFDPATVIDRSTYREPALPPVGISWVLVNGVPVVARGKAVDGVAPGRPMRAPVGGAPAAK